MDKTWDELPKVGDLEEYSLEDPVTNVLVEMAINQKYQLMALLRDFDAKREADRKAVFEMFHAIPKDHPFITARYFADLQNLINAVGPDTVLELGRQ